jgi:hypothetical protein
LSCASRRSFHHLGAEILIDPRDLQLGFIDLRSRLGNGGDQLALLSVETSGIALQSGQASQSYQLLFVQRPHAGEFARDQLELRRFRFDLGIESVDFLLQLRDAAVQQFLLILARARACLEQ